MLRRLHNPIEEGAPLTLRDMVDLFLGAKKLMVPTEMAKRTWEYYKLTSEQLVRILGEGYRVDKMTPNDFAHLRAELAKGVAPITLFSRMGQVRAIFNWATKTELIRAPRYGTSFDKPSRTILRKHRNRKPRKRFTAEQIRLMLDATKQPLHAMILLGINCALGNKDCAELSFKHLDLEGGRFVFPRGKTGVARWGPLWPETVKAIRTSLDSRPKPKEDKYRNRIFITKYGHSWGAGPKHDDPIAKEMRKLCRGLGIYQTGVGFYSLRHTFVTIGRKTADIEAVKFIAGHAEDANDMSAYYDEDDFDKEQVDVQRLHTVTNYVHDWLFPPVEDTTTVDQHTEECPSPGDDAKSQEEERPS